VSESVNIQLQDFIQSVFVHVSVQHVSDLFSLYRTQGLFRPTMAEVLLVATLHVESMLQVYLFLPVNTQKKITQEITWSFEQACLPDGSM
jgi:hypothetical protein